MQFRPRSAAHGPVLPRPVTKRREKGRLCSILQAPSVWEAIQALAASPHPRSGPLSGSHPLSVRPAWEERRWLGMCFDVDLWLPRPDLPWWVSSTGVRACVGERGIKGGRLGPRDADRLLPVPLDASGRGMLSLTVTEVTNQLNFRNDHVKYCLTQRIKLLFRLLALKKRRKRWAISIAKEKKTFRWPSKEPGYSRMQGTPHRGRVWVTA